MTVYAYWGNKHEQLDGTSALIVESGEVMIGYSGEFTDQEFEELSDRYILVQGTVDPDHPIRRLFFPWVREDTISGAVIGGDAGGPPTNVTPPDITPSAPSNTSAPVLSGSAQQDATISTTNGSWQNSPTSFSYQWQKSTNGTSGWTNLSGATANSYTVQSGDVSDYLRCQVTATNDTGSTTANSGVDGPVTSSTSGVPVNLAAPTISGTAQEGDTLHLDDGTWSNSPTSYSFQWQTSANGTSGWTNLSGATFSIYPIQSSDVGNYLRCQVTATNAGGSSSPANSTSTSAVASSGGGSVTPVSVVQSFQASSPESDTDIETFTIKPTAGNTIVFCTNLYNTTNDVISHPTTIIDNADIPNEYTIVPVSPPTTPGNTYGMTSFIAYAENITTKSSGEFQITAKCDLATTFWESSVLELSPSIYDNSVGNVGVNTGATINAGSLTPSENGGLIVGQWGADEGENPGAYTLDSGWTSVRNGAAGNGSTACAYFPQTTEAAVTCEATLRDSTGINWAAVAVSFIPETASSSALFVTSAEGGSEFSTGSTSGQTAAFATAEDDSILLFVRSDNATTISTVTDAIGNTYEPVSGGAGVFSGLAIKPYVCRNSVGANAENVITVGNGTTDVLNYWSLHVQVFRGLPEAVVDVANFADVSNTTAIASSAVTTAMGGEAVGFCVSATQQLVDPIFGGRVAYQTTQANSNNTAAGYQIPGSIKSNVTAQFTATSTANGAISVVSLKSNVISPVSMIQLDSGGWAGVTETGEFGFFSPSSRTKTGSTLVLAIRWSGIGAGSGVTGVTDDASEGTNTWVLDEGSSVITSGIGEDSNTKDWGVLIAYCEDAFAMSNLNFAVTVSSGEIYYAPAIYELSPSVRDNSSHGSGIASGSPIVVDPVAFTPSRKNGFAISNGVCDGGDATPGDGWTSDFAASGFMAQHKSPINTAPLQADMKIGANGHWVLDQILFVS